MSKIISILAGILEIIYNILIVSNLHSLNTLYNYIDIRLCTWSSHFKIIRWVSNFHSHLLNIDNKN